MNSQKLVRTTFVLSRETHAQLEYLSSRTGFSRSYIVRDFLTGPVLYMARWASTLPANATEEDFAYMDRAMRKEQLAAARRDVAALFAASESTS